MPRAPAGWRIGSTGRAQAPSPPRALEAHGVAHPLLLGVGGTLLCPPGLWRGAALSWGCGCWVWPLR